MGSAQSFGGSAYAAVSRNPHALPPGARGSAPGCVIPRLTSHPGSQATPRNRLTIDPATVPQDDPTTTPRNRLTSHTKTPHTTPRNHPTKPLRGFARTPDRGAISRDAGSGPRFAGTPFSSGVALPQLLVVRRSKRPTAARYEQGWWDTT